MDCSTLSSHEKAFYELSEMSLSWLDFSNNLIILLLKINASTNCGKQKPPS